MSWLSKVGKHPIGVDIEPKYVEAYKKGGGEAMLGSATAIPFDDYSYFGVWSIGVLHHLPDEVATAAISETVRVSRSGGYIAILDAILPTSIVRWPIPTFIRYMDRGRHMRKESALKALLDPFGDWHYHRFVYTATGLEMLACVHYRR